MIVTNNLVSNPHFFNPPQTVPNITSTVTIIFYRINTWVNVILLYLSLSLRISLIYYSCNQTAISGYYIII